jgi:hypothetical protein
MHCANRSIALRWLADKGGGWPPFGSLERHDFMADWNAGPLTATPLTDVPDGVTWIWTPWPDGSGKLGTPLARMHRAKPTIAPDLNGDATLAPEGDAALDPGLEEPQAARGSAISASPNSRFMVQVVRAHRLQGGNNPCNKGRRV